MTSPEDLFTEWHGSAPDIDMFDSLPFTARDRVCTIGRAREITYKGKWGPHDKFVHYHETKPKVGAVAKSAPRGVESVKVGKFMRDGCSVVYLGRLLAFVFEDMNGVLHAFRANPSRDEVFAVNTGVLLLPRTPEGPLFIYGGSGSGLRITAEGIAG